jgi:hypothetical protein
MTRTLTCTLLTLSLGAIVAGCSGGSSHRGGAASTTAPTTSAGGGQNLTVEITDAPLRDLSGVTKAQITVSKVFIHAAQVGSSTTAGQGSSQGGALSQSQQQANTGGAVAQGGKAKGKGKGKAKAKAGKGQGKAKPAKGAAAGQGNKGGAGSKGKGQNAGGTNPKAGGGVANSSAWIVLFDAATSGAPQSFNLLDLRGGLVSQLASAQVAPGKYTHIRMVIEEAEIVLNGTTYSTQNGLLTLPGSNKIDVPFTGKHQLSVQAGQPARALLDFDLANSFDYQGPASAPTSFRLRPVIRGANRGVSGAIAGVVLSDNGTPNDSADDLPLGKVTVTASQKGGATVTTYTDRQGVYFVPGLDEGDWDVSFDSTGYASHALTGVTVKRREQTTRDATLAKK